MVTRIKSYQLFYACILAFVLNFNIILCLNNGKGLTPPMGWSSWNHYGCGVTEQLVIKAADMLVEKGLAAKGYKYVNIDDCWQIDRNQTTKQLIADPHRFPNGIKYLADYVHKKGLYLGISSDAGVKTCEGRPGSYGYEEIDAQTFAKWEVDYLKYDYCYANVGKPPILLYFNMYQKLNATKRQIFYSISNWGLNEPWKWGGGIANAWRTTNNIEDSWQSITQILDSQNGLQMFAGPGGWNDPDMLEVGNGGMTQNQYQVHFVMWAILKAPLILGCDLSHLSGQLLSILTNQQVIAVNQDPLGIQAHRLKKKVSSEGTSQIWGGGLSNDRYLIVFLNLSEKKQDLEIDLQKSIQKRFKHYDARNILLHREEGRSTDIILNDALDPRTVSAYVLSFDQATSTKIQKIKSFKPAQPIKNQ